MTTPQVPDDALALLRESQDRVLELEGIPMLLVLADETGDPAEVLDATAREEGARLATLMDDLGQALTPSGRDGDLGRVVTVLQAASYLDFGQGRARS